MVLLAFRKKDNWGIHSTYFNNFVVHASTDGLIRKAAEQRANRLTHAEFEREATWATRKFVPFVMQRISVAVQIAAATEIRQALGRGMGPDSA